MSMAKWQLYTTNKSERPLVLVAIVCRKVSPPACARFKDTENELGESLLPTVGQ